MSFYVYRYTDPTNMEPIYIGKGTGSRLNAHWNQRIHDKNDNHPFIRRLRKIQKTGNKPIIEKIWEQDDSFESDELAEEFALLVEQEAIDKYGRRDLGAGSLWNLTNGGEGVSNPSFITRDLISIGAMYNTAHLGCKHTKDDRLNISKGVRKAHSEGRGIYKGYKQSEEHSAKISDSLKGNQNAKGYKRTDAERKAISERTKGNQNWLGKTHKEESKKKLSEQKKGGIWITDGKSNKYIADDSNIPSGWKIGRATYEKKFVCPICDKKYGKAAFFRKHVLKEHDFVKESEIDDFVASFL